MTRQQKINNTPVLTSLRHPKETRSDLAFILNTVGKLWLAGVTINWSKLYPRDRPQRVPLPTYPFERQRYWIEPQSQFAAEIPQKQGKKPDIADWFYVPSWKQSPLINSVNLILQSSWLLFIDESDIGTKIAARLQKEGQEVITVKIGDKFTKDSNTYTVNPEKEKDYDNLIKSLQNLEKIPNKIIHFWGIESEIDRKLDCYSLLYLTKALDRQHVNSSISLTVVSDRIYEVTGAEKLQPEKATVLGLVKVIPQEYRHINCRNIDLDLSQNNPQLIKSLFAELTIQSPNIAIAYRHKQRWVQIFEPIFLPKINAANLRQKGVYLITGGLGNIGLLLASFLAKKFKAKLILIGRSGLPERSQWSEILENKVLPNLLCKTNKELMPQAKIVADNFHVMKQVNDELDAARKKITREAERLKNKSKKEKILSGLTKSKYVLLKNQEDLKESEQEKLQEIERIAPVLRKMHGLKEKLRNIFETNKNWSEGLLNLADWLKDIFEYFPKSFGTIKRWIGEIIAYFDEGTTQGVVAGINNKLKLIKRRAFGFRNFDNFQLRSLLTWHFAS
nr:transposase [Hyella patelloides]